MAEINQNNNRSSVGLLARHGGLTYIQIPAIDLHRSAMFYQNVLGWNIDRRSEQDIRFQDTTGHLIGKWTTDQTPQKAGFLPYFYVNRIEEVVDQVAKHGGEVTKAPYPEGNLSIAMILDPAGNALGLWEAK